MRDAIIGMPCGSLLAVQCSGEGNNRRRSQWLVLIASVCVAQPGVGLSFVSHGIFTLETIFQTYKEKGARRASSSESAGAANLRPPLLRHRDNTNEDEGRDD
jgi:hypothetical protein